MEGAASRLEGDRPPVEEHSHAIDCPVSVLENLRASVLEQFNSAPHGGGEITGVLFGTRNGDEVRITAFRPSGSTSEFEQSEALTETQQAISAVIVAAREQKELAELEPVGWFRAHPRCHLNLAERDLEIANALFAQLWQVVLVMRPANSAATRVCFYFREREGPWTAECAVREFTLPAAAGLEPPGFVEEPVEHGDMALMNAELPPPMTPILAPPQKRTTPRLAVIALGVAAIAALGGGIFYYRFMRPQPLGLSVRATESVAQLRIAWDRTARPVRQAKAGYVEIADGGQTERVDLDATQLRIGYVNYPRRSNQVAVRLVVMPQGGSPAEEDTQFVAAAETASNQAGGEGAAETTELDVPVPVDTAAPAKEYRKFQPPTAAPMQTAPVEEAPAPEVGAPAQVARATAAPIVIAPPVVRSEPPAEKPAPPPRTTLASALAGAAPAQAQSPARVTAPRVAAAPSSGRVIWIGRLQKNQPLAITGKTSSTGTLIGELPARPFKFSISPGDLSSDGIVLYTSNLQYANSVVEPPDAQNGWNKTVYTWNPKFANDISLDEGPAAQNGWSRMVLHSKNPKISVIVIDWTAVN